MLIWLASFPGFVLTSALTTFLYPALRNSSIAARKKRQRSTGGDDQLPLIVEDAARENSSREELAVSLQALSEDHREILLIRMSTR